MALDVGAVTLDYSVSPRTEIVERYARVLKGYDEGDCWRVAANGHVFIEMDYEAMTNHAWQHIASHDFKAAEAHQIMRWVRGLPWRDGMVMLHMGW